MILNLFTVNVKILLGIDFLAQLTTTATCSFKNKITLKIISQDNNENFIGILGDNRVILCIC